MIHSFVYPTKRLGSLSSRPTCSHDIEHSLSIEDMCLELEVNFFGSKEDDSTYDPTHRPSPEAASDSGGRHQRRCVTSHCIFRIQRSQVTSTNSRMFTGSNVIGVPDSGYGCEKKASPWAGSGLDGPGWIRDHEGLRKPHNPGGS